MKKLLSLITIAAAGSMFAALQIGCTKTPENQNATSNANLATPAATPDKAAIEAELTRIENDWPRIIKEHDAATVKRIEADDAVIVYPDGSAGNKEQDVKDMESGALTADAWEVADIKVNVLNNDTAIATGRSIVKNGKYNGHPFPSNEFRWLDTYVRRNGQWQLIAAANTPVKNPTGPAAKASPSPVGKASPSPAAKASPSAKPSAATRPSPVKSPLPAKTP